MTEPSPFDKSDDASLAQSPVSHQIQFSVLGEALGFGISIGAVYLAEHAFPKQMESFVGKLAEKIGEWRKTSPEIQHAAAKKMADFTIMNLGGLSNMGVQFGLRRHAQKPEERQPFAYEFGRVISGRVAGTITAAGALALAEAYAPSHMRKAQGRISGWVGNGKAGDRFGELAVSNLVQSFGGVAGNAPAQLLYDKLVNHDPKKTR